MYISSLKLRKNGKFATFILMGKTCFSLPLAIPIPGLPCWFVVAIWIIIAVLGLLFVLKNR